MSISRKMLGFVAALTALGCVAATASLPATAATPACGKGCASVFSKVLGNPSSPGVVEAVLGGQAIVGALQRRRKTGSRVAAKSRASTPWAWCRPK